MKKLLYSQRWLILISLFIIIVTTIPYLIGYSLENQQNQFSGFIIGVEDGNSYIAKMLLGTNGKWLFTTPYTAYPQNEFFAFFPYILLGKLAANPEIRLQLVMLFHVFRIIGIIFLVFETYLLSLSFLEDRKKSTLVTFLLIFGGGIGWIGVIFPEIVNNRMPLEFYSPETFGFLSAFSLPHLLFGRAFLFKSFRTFLQINIIDVENKFLLALSGLWLLVSGIFQPLNLIIGWAVVGSYLLFQLITKKLKISKIFLWVYWFLPSVPLLFYNLFSFLFDPFLSSWQGQNRIPSPPVFDYLLAYGLGLASIAFLIFKKREKEIKNIVFLYSWLIVLPVLIYLPLNIQRRLSEGVWFCFSVFLAFLIFEIKNRSFQVFLVFLLSFSSILVLFGSISTVRNVSEPVYIPNSVREVADQVEMHMKVDDVVLAPYYESNVLPSFIPVKVLTGHGPESMNLEEISPYLDNFYRGNLSINEMNDFVEEFNIKFIIIPSKYEIGKLATQLSSFTTTIHYQNNDYLLVEINEKP